MLSHLCLPITNPSRHVTFVKYSYCVWSDALCFRMQHPWTEAFAQCCRKQEPCQALQVVSRCLCLLVFACNGVQCDNPGSCLFFFYVLLLKVVWGCCLMSLCMTCFVLSVLIECDHKTGNLRSVLLCVQTCVTSHLKSPLFSTRLVNRAESFCMSHMSTRAN